MSEPENITPAHLRCSVGGCSSIHRQADGTLLVVGDTAPPSKWPAGLAVGAEESAVIISPELLDSLKAEWLREATEQRDRVADALENLMTNHARLVGSGDCGNWEVDEEPEMIAARAALDALDGRPTPGEPT